MIFAVYGHCFEFTSFIGTVEMLLWEQEGCPACNIRAPVVPKGPFLVEPARPGETQRLLFTV